MCVASGLAQGNTNVHWKCDKPSGQQSIPVGDKPGHAYAIQQINCTAMKGDIGGNKMNSGMGTEFLDVRGDHVTEHGEFIESMENGDKNLYKYEFSVTTKDGVFESGTNKWSLIEGGGKMKGGKANGTCKRKSQSRPVHRLRLHGNIYPSRDLEWLQPELPSEECAVVPTALLYCL